MEEEHEQPVWLGYGVLKQRVDLDIDFAHRSLKGSTEITIQPLARDLREINLHCRQCRPLSVQAGGITAQWEYEDPYRRVRMPARSTVHQHEMLKEKIKAALGPAPRPELAVKLPAKLKIQELHMDTVTALPQYDGTPSLQKQESDAMAVAETPVVQAAQSQGPQFAPIKLTIEFEVNSFRDGIHWIGFASGDARYPHLYTKVDLTPGNTSCIFPCLDDATSRCSWELAIRCPKTLGDAFRKPRAISSVATIDNSEPDVHMTNGDSTVSRATCDKAQIPDQYFIDLSDEEKLLDLTVVCVGDLVEDITDSDDETRHTMSFSLTAPVTARHVAFAIGPFEHIDLSAFRESEDEERLGSSAVKIDGYCLPGRADEVRNTCFPIHQAVDFFGVNYGSFPFGNYQMLFVDDHVHDHSPAAGLSVCSTRLLFPEDIIEPLERNTRVLIRTVADQWIGVNVVAKAADDEWVVAGIAGFMTDLFIKKLCGNNEYRWQQKMAAEKVYDLDADRPCIAFQGRLLHLDPSVRDFVNTKSAVILFILDRRLMKASGSTGVTRIINKIFLNAKTGTLNNGELSTADFQRQCERLGHNKLDSFFKQWVTGAGCPIFEVRQRFNKKKLVVEMTINQKQLERQTKPPFAPDNFMREIKEYIRDVWAEAPSAVFTGPMTIRIHEADGTPYEHIVEIKEAITKIDIPYNTKYKRLKRSKRQKERQQATGDMAGDGGDEALLYCLGDILYTPEEIAEWQLMDWSPEDLEKMGQESYEWIRVDADFEWIGKIHLVMPTYMYVSQLQQDRDLVAQFEALKQIIGANPNQTSLSILVRTLMDRRYFHGIRVKAAEGLAMLASAARDDLRDVGRFHLEKAFQDMFCFEGSVMPRPNDFSSRVNFIMQCAIPQAMARLRDADGKVPLAVRRFFVDKLKFNDNSNNEFSDVHYVATLMTCLAESLVVSHREHRASEPSYTFSFGDDEPMDDPTTELENVDADFEKEAINEIERYRRIDEWISTYQNIYSTTALECLQSLTQAGIAKDKNVEIVQYTRSGNADNVRLAAFRCLVETQLTRRMTVMKYLLHSLADDSSPYFRQQLLRRFGEALGHIALGDAVSQNEPVPATIESGLVLEQEVSQAVRQREADRNSPNGAIAALKHTLGDDEIFKHAVWYATTSSNVILDEAAALADVSGLLYEPKSSLPVSLKLPRMYRVENAGRGKLRFYQQGPYRATPSKPLALDDWETLQRHGLRYEGPLAPDIISAQVEEKLPPLRLHPPSQQQQQPVQDGAMGPPLLAVEKPHPKVKLSLGKRKQSMADTPREGSPKAQKTAKQQTPSAMSKSPSRGSPSVASCRGSTPGSTASAGRTEKPKKIVKWRFGLKASSAAQKILSSPSSSSNLKATPQPANTSGGKPRQVSRSITPSIQQQQPSYFAQPAVQSPTSPHQFFSPPGLAGSPLQASPFGLGNVGGFRSFEPATPAPDANLATFRSFGSADSMPLADVKKEFPSNANGFPSASPPALVPGEQAMPPPSQLERRPTLKLKLKPGKRPSGD